MRERYSPLPANSILRYVRHCVCVVGRVVGAELLDSRRCLWLVPRPCLFAVECKLWGGRNDSEYGKPETFAAPYFLLACTERPYLVFQSCKTSALWLVVAISTPHWFVTLLFALFAAIPWIRRKWRFSLRTLFIVTTLVAVMLGLIAWMVHR